MAGHSKWANIKHRKGAADAKRGKIFTKLIREVTVAARIGGGLIDMNPRLRLAVEKARGQSVPKDTIERAIKKGTGELAGEAIEEITYEGYAPAGVAILVECTTDNRTRTVAEIRNIFSKKGGNMGESGSVAWMFDRKGVVRVAVEGISEDNLIEKALDLGAEDVKNEEGAYSVLTPHEKYSEISENLRQAGFKVLDAEINFLPKNSVAVIDVHQAESILALIEALEENEDVQNVWANFDISDELMEQIASKG